MDLMENTNMKKNTMVLMILSCVYISVVFGQQQYPQLTDVKIISNIIYDSNEKVWYYSYILMNSSANIGSISDLEIDISRNPNTLNIDTIGLRFENDGFTEASFRRSYPNLKDNIVPVGFIRTPNVCWIGGLTYRYTFSISADSAFINPGTSLNGFEIMSKGMPSIRRCIVSPFFDVVSLFPDPDDTTINYYVPPVDSVRNAVKYYGWTIGPSSPPISFIPINWCDTLSSYTTQSRSLGWVKDQTTANKYLGYFVSAKTSLIQNNITSARTTLQQVLSDVNIDSTNNLTSEAYALIRYNTEYLLAKLSTPPPTYSLAVSTVGNGSVTLNPNQTRYDSASTVQLAATPQQNNELSGWSGDLTGKANPASIIMNANKSVTATFTPSPVWTNDGPTTFDGTSTYIDGGKTPGSASNLTVAFYMTAHKLANMVPADKLPTTGKAGWSVKMRSNGDLWFRIGSDKTKTDVTKSGAYSANTKVHITCTFGSGTAKIYVNGVLVTTKTKITYTVNNTTTNLRLGIPSVAAITEKFDGVLEQVKVYNQVLTAAQISSLAGK
jgi:hypothetical protein